jgi:hypothetical protein
MKKNRSRMNRTRKEYEISAQYSIERKSEVNLLWKRVMEYVCGRSPCEKGTAHSGPLASRLPATENTIDA